MRLDVLRVVGKHDVPRRMEVADSSGEHAVEEDPVVFAVAPRGEAVCAGGEEPGYQVCGEWGDGGERNLWGSVLVSWGELGWGERAYTIHVWAGVALVGGEFEPALVVLGGQRLVEWSGKGWGLAY